MDVSLGDSYSSGEAAGQYDATFLPCHRSPHAWPRLLGVAPALHLACSGAEIRDLMERPQAIKGPDPPVQVRHLGQIARSTEIDTVYLTIGGNDLGFAAKLVICRFLDGCLRDARALRRELDRLAPRLGALYREVLRASGARRLVVVGYPEITPEAGQRTTGCDWLGADEQENAARFAGWLDAMLLRAATGAGAEYVSVRDALDGHELCTPDSWMRGILQWGDPLLTTEHGHPEEPGQRAIAAAVADELEARDTLAGSFGARGGGPGLLDELAGG